LKCNTGQNRFAVASGSALSAAAAIFFGYPTYYQNPKSEILPV